VSDFYAELQKQGVKVDRDVYDAASGWIADDIGYEITYSKWGEKESRQRVNRADPQVQAAAELLQKATDPTSLFKLSDTYAATHGLAKKPGEPQTSQKSH
jgi:hypothetical protein